MKTADIRLLALAVFSLALSLPVSAWLYGRAAAFANKPPVPSGAASVQGRYQMFVWDSALCRVDTQTGLGEQYYGSLRIWFPFSNEKVSWEEFQRRTNNQ